MLEIMVAFTWAIFSNLKLISFLVTCIYINYGVPSYFLFTCALTFVEDQLESGPVDIIATQWRRKLAFLVNVETFNRRI